ncbi:unnamed protein product [Polarella glacialis]|uniref:Endonuclease/exonuclease/phosphatase domain-containing protein n=1 Tax=Polarella glacialis TaxID=89957 RepID=A0A813HMG2_POLGL|nr:unnamed protein product [Polarella glacialis]
MGRAASDQFVDMLNQFLEAQQAYCDAKGEELFEIPEALRAQLCPMFHCVSWWRLDDLLKRCEDEFVNAYQEAELKKHGRSSRMQGNFHMEVLRGLKPHSAEEAFERAAKRERAIFSMSPQQWQASNYWELGECVPGCRQLSLLSFNLNILAFGVSYWSPGLGEHSGSRLRGFLERVRRELEAEAQSKNSLDVIALQELFASPFVPGFCSQAYAVRAMADMGYTAVIGPKPSFLDLSLRGKWTDSGLVIFSRLPVVESKSLRFAAGAAMDAGACKGAMWARIELANGRFLDVFNCHLQASHTGAGAEIYDRIRQSQLAELREFVQLSGTEHPYVLTGDFNVDAIPEPSDPMGTYGISFRPPRQESEDYQRMVLGLDPNRCLIDLLCGPTRDEPLGPTNRFLGHSSEPRHPCTRPPRLRMPDSARYVARHKYPQRLDYIFYRPTLNSLVEHSDSNIEKFEVQGEPFEYLSDHFGIRANFRLRCSFAWSSALQAKPQGATDSEVSFLQLVLFVICVLLILLL